MIEKRGSGMLLHISSLPSRYGIGDLGPAAYEFADFLVDSRQSYWQILPLNPTEPLHGNSPYHSDSAFAGNPILISPETLVRDGWLENDALQGLPSSLSGWVDYKSVASQREKLLRSIFEKGRQDQEYDSFVRDNSLWLDDYALFSALKAHFNGTAWVKWPKELRDRDPEAIRKARENLSEEIRKASLLQYLFFRQWDLLRQYCNEKGIKIIGDMPIYVIHDSADVWSNPDFFNLDQDRRPLTVAGVPPDYFSETGQYWGNPVYNWEALKQTGYNWWIKRIRHNLNLYDFVRIDHFRGFLSYWAIPADEINAINGKWIKGPGMDFFNRVAEEFPAGPIIAEDLGFITQDVHELMHHFNFPGMKVLLFAFGEDMPENPYIPHNLEKDCILYTGTHDNNTSLGWFLQEADHAMKDRFFKYIGRDVPDEKVPKELIRLAMMSIADMVIFPIQDLLGLDGSHRMNTPGTSDGNWGWRLREGALDTSFADELRRMTEIYGRA